MFNLTSMKTLLVCVVIATLIQYIGATTYAQFCSDDSCEENCGTSVSVDNSDCLVESGRGSIKFHDLNFGSVSLIATNNDQCSCQSHCYPHIVKGTASPPGCFNLKDPMRQFKSFRFVNVDLAGGCSKDENTCDGSV